ncbi:NAD(P)-dependent oxidoreductase [Paenarthrobacter nicotinovorans]|uniref:NAD(P)-dependent oxidoreductase n=1 Tax=Paenarthrobacter nicotinovorans TaxID=29320 RepID=UPI003814574F
MATIYVSGPIDREVLADIANEVERLYLGFGPDAVDYREVAGEIDGVVERGRIFTRSDIEASPRLRIIARHGVGKDNIDLEAAEECGVRVTTTAGSNSNAVAEHVFALLLNGARSICAAANEVSSGHWGEAKKRLVGVELKGRTIGIIGFGAIGRRVAHIACAFGMDILVTDPIVEPDTVAAAGGKLVDFDTLIRRSDAITVHAPLTPSTHHLIGPDQISVMKPGTYVINTARGGLVDEATLIDALQAGRLGGVALDVLEAEKHDINRPLEHTATPYSGIPGLTITPHIGGQTAESLKTTGAMAWESVREELGLTAAGRTLPRRNDSVIAAI